MAENGYTHPGTLEGGKGPRCHQYSLLISGRREAGHELLRSAFRTDSHCPGQARQGRRPDQRRRPDHARRGKPTSFTVAMLSNSFSIEP